MADLIVSPVTGTLLGSVPAPPDRAILDRALLAAALADGESEIFVTHLGRANITTLRAVDALGATAVDRGDAIVVKGFGVAFPKPDAATIHCERSVELLGLLMGALSVARRPYRLTLDDAAGAPDISGIARPLRSRSAAVEGRLDPSRPGNEVPPVEVGRDEAPPLTPLEHTLGPGRSLEKSALLFSGVFADGPTTIEEPELSPDHTERLLASMGADVERLGSVTRLTPTERQSLDRLSMTPVGDVSGAAFILAAAALVPGSRVSVRRTGTNPTRTGLFDLLRDMGAELAIEGAADEHAEPFATVTMHATPLARGTLGGETLWRAQHDLAAAVAFMAGAEGESRIFPPAAWPPHLAEPLPALMSMVRAFGVPCESLQDGLVIDGRQGQPFVAAEVDAAGRGDLAMLGAVLGLRADGASRVRNADGIADMFPRFVGTLRALGAHIAVE